MSTPTIFYEFLSLQWLSPLSSAFLVQLIPSAIIATVPASWLWFRRLALAIVAALTVHIIFNIETVIENFNWRTTFAATAAILFFRSADVMCLHPLNREDIQSNAESDKAEGLDHRAQSLLETNIVLAWRSLWNMRGIQTARINRDIPPFSSKDKTFVPSRAAFLFQKLATVVVLACAIDLFASIPPENVEMNYSLAKQHVMLRLGDFDGEEVFLRILGTLGFWVNITCYISVMYGCLAIVFVGLGLDDPIDWPPCFGSLGDGWTLRRFWGLTWHQTLRSLLGSNCDYLLLSVFQLPRRALFTYYARLTASFALSGLLHHIVDMTLNIPSKEAGMMRFFMMQPFGMAFEDFVAWLWRKASGGVKIGNTSARILGYIWIAVWLVWVTPGIFYPYIRLGERSNLAEHRMLPFSFADVFLKGNVSTKHTSEL